MKTKKVKSYGMLYSNGREYFALSPVPAISEEWEWEQGQKGVYRFEVVPRKDLRELKRSLALALRQYDDLKKYQPLYPHARHIITNSFVLEYADMPEITIKILDIGDE